MRQRAAAALAAICTAGTAGMFAMGHNGTLAPEEVIPWIPVLSACIAGGGMWLAASLATKGRER